MVERESSRNLVEVSFDSGEFTSETSQDLGVKEGGKQESRE